MFCLGLWLCCSGSVAGATCSAPTVTDVIALVNVILGTPTGVPACVCSPLPDTGELIVTVDSSAVLTGVNAIRTKELPLTVDIVGMLHDSALTFESFAMHSSGTDPRNVFTLVELCDMGGRGCTAFGGLFGGPLTSSNGHTLTFQFLSDALSPLGSGGTGQ